MLLAKKRKGRLRETNNVRTRTERRKRGPNKVQGGVERGSGLRGAGQRGPEAAGRSSARRGSKNARAETEAPVAPITSASISAILAKVPLMVVSRRGRSGLHAYSLPSPTRRQTGHRHQALLQGASAALPRSRERFTGTCTAWSSLLPLRQPRPAPRANAGS